MNRYGVTMAVGASLLLLLLSLLLLCPSSIIIVVVVQFCFVSCFVGKLNYDAVVCSEDLFSRCNSTHVQVFGTNSTCII